MLWKEGKENKGKKQAINHFEKKKKRGKKENKKNINEKM